MGTEVVSLCACFLLRPSTRPQAKITRTYRCARRSTRPFRKHSRKVRLNLRCHHVQLRQRAAPLVAPSVTDSPRWAPGHQARPRRLPNVRLSRLPQARSRCGRNPAGQAPQPARQPHRAPPPMRSFPTPSLKSRTSSARRSRPCGSDSRASRPTQRERRETLYNVRDSSKFPPMLAGGVPQDKEC